MNQTKRKGFTLTEIIVVIAIIGILAAVLIPSITGYIKKAKIAKGVAEAGNMNVILAAESIYQEREYFEPYEVTRIIKEANYSLTSTLNDYRFWYDASENKVKFLPFEKVFGSVSAANNSFSQDCIEAMSSSHPEYRYVDQYDDEITAIVTTVRNLIQKGLDEAGYPTDETITLAQKKTVFTNMSNLFDQAVEQINNVKISGFNDSKISVTNFAKTFNPYDSLYISNNVMYNAAYLAESVSELDSLGKENIRCIQNGTSTTVSVVLSHLIFEDGITIVPQSNIVSKSNDVAFDITIDTAFEIPDTVTTLSQDCFLDVTYCVGVATKNTLMFSGEIDQCFSPAMIASKVDRVANVSYIKLELGTDFNVTYADSEMKLSNGKIVNVALGGKDISELVDVVDASDQSAVVVSKYVIPNIELNNSKIDYSKIKKIVIRRSIIDNICTYTAIIVDSDLKCYKVENFGYVSDVDWHIEQKFDPTNKKAVISVYLPAYVYNFANFRDVHMKVTYLPQYLKTTTIQGIYGQIEVSNGIALSQETLFFNIRDGIYDSKNNRYVYSHTLDLSKISVILANNDTPTCNQVTISQIAMFTGTYIDEDNYSNVNNMFIRYYK